MSVLTYQRVKMRRQPVQESQDLKNAMKVINWGTLHAWCASCIGCEGDVREMRAETVKSQREFVLA